MRNKFKILFVFCIIIYYSCQRETVNLDIKSKKIQSAKTWFNKFIEQGNVQPVFNNVHYHWDKASKFVYANGYESISIPITEKGQNPDYYGYRVLHLFPWKNGRGYYHTIYEVIPDKMHLKQNGGQVNLRKFDGIIAAWDLKKGFSRGIAYKKSVAIDNIELKQIDPLTFSTIETNSLPGVTVTGYIPSANWSLLWIRLLGNLGFNTSNLWGGGANPCEYTGCGQSENPVDYIDPNTLISDNDDYDGNPEIQNLKDSLTNPCLDKVLDSAIANNLKNDITDILKNTFGANKDFDLDFLDSREIGGDTMALSTGLKDIVSGKVSITIFLNQQLLPLASQEYITATIYHEIIHAYLFANGIYGGAANHHALMGTLSTGYFDKLKNSLLNRFPNLSPFEAEALTWGGLNGTPSLDSIKVNDNPTYNDIQRENVAHKNNTESNKGTPCND